MADDVTPNTDTSFTESPAAEAQPAQSPETSSQPSAAETGKTPKETMLDAVLKVVPATTEKSAEQVARESAAPDAQKADSPEQAEEPDEPDDDTQDEEPTPPETAPAVRKKINKLLRQRRELRDAVQTLEPAAEIGTQLHRFASENDLSGDDVRLCLQLGAYLRVGDYEAFYKSVAPYVRRAQEYLGLVLPTDLGQRVQRGDMTAETAKELARQRYDQQLAEAVHISTQQQAVQHHRESMQDSVKRAVSVYEQRIAASDPDYKAKADSVQQYAKALLFERGGSINTVQDALDITQRAYAEVNKQFKAFMPKPRATNLLPNGSSPSMNGARPAPRTMMEAALQGLENARRQP